MNRRSFFSTLGAAVAACVLKPFEQKVWRGKETGMDWCDKVERSMKIHGRICNSQHGGPAPFKIIGLSDEKSIVKTLPEPVKQFHWLDGAWFAVGESGRLYTMRSA